MQVSGKILLGLTLIASVELPGQTKAPEPEPVAWGVLGNNTGCVIFAEGHKTSGRFYGVAITTKTVGTLTAIEPQSYTYDQKALPETQENMDTLMRLAQKDHVKFVKIPEKHSPELLEKARRMCKTASE